MSLSIATVILSSSSIISFFAFVMSLKGYFQTRYLHFAYLSLTWFFMSIGNMFLALAYNYLNVPLYVLGINITAPIAFSIMLLVDSISREKVDPIKLFVITIASTGLIISSFEPGSVRLNVSALNETTLALQGSFLVFGSLVFIISGFIVALLHDKDSPGSARINEKTFHVEFTWCHHGRSRLGLGVFKWPRVVFSRLGLLVHFSGGISGDHCVLH